MMASITNMPVGARRTALATRSLTTSSAVPFARNDLLFTMSDNTRHAHGPWTGRNRIREFVFLRTSLKAEFYRDRRWWSQTGSNRRPPACKAGALPTELWPLIQRQTQREAPPPPKLRRQPSFRRACQAEAPQGRRLVGLGRFELPTSRLSSARSNQLSYRPREHTLITRASRKTEGQRMLQRPMGIAWARPRRKRNEDGEVPPKDMPILKLTCPDVFLRDPIGHADACA